LSEDKTPSVVTMESIKEMARLTVFSGRLNDFQQKNLKMFPMVFFNGVSSVKIDYDLSTSPAGELGKAYNKSSISYHLNLDENQSDTDKRFAFLTRSVRMLLWNDIQVSVYFNDIKVFESKDERRQ
jgi:hypothetical protein